eukprot:1524983-Rhodomonas_salina.1
MQSWRPLHHHLPGTLSERGALLQGLGLTLSHVRSRSEGWGRRELQIRFRAQTSTGTAKSKKPHPCSRSVMARPKKTKNKPVSERAWEFLPGYDVSRRFSHA